MLTGHDSSVILSVSRCHCVAGRSTDGGTFVILIGRDSIRFGQCDDSSQAPECVQRLCITELQELSDEETRVPYSWRKPYPDWRRASTYSPIHWRWSSIYLPMVTPNLVSCRLTNCSGPRSCLYCTDQHVACSTQMNRHPNSRRSSNQSVATVYEHARAQVFQEIDDPDDIGTTSFWRKLVLEAAREQVAPDWLPHETDRDKETWTFLVECLMGCVLWDNDYECQESLDIPPEESRHLRAILGVADDYHTEVPPDPPDEQVNLYVDALMGLTAGVR